MPGIAHETLVTLLKSHPEWLQALLAVVAKVPLPGPLTVLDTAIRFVEPAEVRPDLLFATPNEHQWLLVEVQNEIDPAKQRRWLLASAALLNERGTMGDVVVLTAQRHVAHWAHQIAQAKGPLGTHLGLTPVVVLLAEETLDPLLDPAHPELGFFAAWAMHERHGPEAQKIVWRALEITSALPPELRTVQVRAIFNVLSERMLKALQEASMDSQLMPESPAVRAWREELEARGEARGEAKALLAILTARQFPVDDATRTRILNCTDLAVLERWIRQAAISASVAELFEAFPPA